MQGDYAGTDPGKAPHKLMVPATEQRRRRKATNEIIGEEKRYRLGVEDG